jgi:hypothetical protein
MLANRHAWEESSFKKEKDDLRKKYEINRKKSAIELKVPKLVLLEYLNRISHPNARRPN